MEPTKPTTQLNLKGIREFINNMEIAKLTNRDYHSHMNTLFKLLPSNPISSTEIVKIIKTQNSNRQKKMLTVLVKFAPDVAVYKTSYEEVRKEINKIVPAKFDKDITNLGENILEIQDPVYKFLFQILHSRDTPDYRMMDYHTLKINNFDKKTDNYLTVGGKMVFNTLIKVPMKFPRTFVLPEELKKACKKLITNLKKTQDKLISDSPDTFTKKTGRLAKQVGIGKPSLFRKLAYQNAQTKEDIKAHDRLAQIALDHNHSIQTAVKYYQ